MKRWLVIWTAIFAAPLCAQAPTERESGEAPPAVEAPPPPDILSGEEAPLPPKEVGSDQLVPAVRIRREDGQMIEEYSVNGKIYMIKVTPNKGPAYYLIDTDGDGDLETKDVESDPGIRPVYWKLFEWE